jgi:AcrR family transcriptional regulator
MPKLKPQELETRRQEIITAARACFLRNGFHQTTTDQICHEANITPGGLYHYFGSKDELIAAVIDHSAELVVETLRESIEEANSAESAFRQTAMFFMQTWQDPEIDNITRLELEIWAESAKNPKLAEKSRRAWAMRMQVMEALIRRGLGEGVYDPEVADPRGMASLMLAQLAGLRIGHLLWEPEFDLNGALRAMFLMHSGRLVGNLPGGSLIPGK